MTIWISKTVTNSIKSSAKQFVHFVVKLGIENQLDFPLLLKDCSERSKAGKGKQNIDYCILTYNIHVHIFLKKVQFDIKCEKYQNRMVLNLKYLLFFFELEKHIIHLSCQRLLFSFQLAYSSTSSTWGIL